MEINNPWIKELIYWGILIGTVLFAGFMSWLFRKVIPWSKDKDEDEKIP